MTNLYQNLKQARSEEDVKDIYIKALGLKSYSKGLIDIIDVYSVREQYKLNRPDVGATP